MASVTVYTKEHMDELADSTVVSGEVVGDNLHLTTRGGDDIDAGNVRGGSIEDFTFEDLASRDAETAMVTGSFGWVSNIDRIYRYDGSEWVELDLSDGLHAVDFGVLANGSNDDTSALQSAVNACIGPGDPTVVGRQALYRLILPQGTIKLTAGIYARGVRGFVVAGAGVFLTFIDGYGTFTSLIEFDGAAYCAFERFSMRCQSGTITNLLYVHQGTGTAIGCTRNDYRHLHASTGAGVWINAFAMGTDATRAVDSQNFYSCFVSGGWSTGNTTTYQYGFRFGNGGAGNVLANNLYGCAVYNVRYPSGWNGSSGGWYGGQVSTSEVVGFSTGNINRTVTLQGIRIESSERIWQCGTGSGSGAIAGISLRDIEYNAANLATDTYVIDHRIGGTLNIDNVTVVGASVGIDPSVFLTTQGTSTLTIIVNGLAMQTAFANAFTGSSIGVHKKLIIVAYTELSDTPDGDVLTSMLTMLNNGSTWNSKYTEMDLALMLGASTSERGSVVLPHGTAPSSPYNGEMWTTTTGLFIKINGVIKQVTLT